MSSAVHVTLIGGPTVLIEFAGIRILTDPTFDQPSSYQLGAITLKKTSSPAISIDAIGHIDIVLLSHDQHPDNLDTSGRAFLANVPQIITTSSGAKRLQNHAQGLNPWEAVTLQTPDGHALTITAAPARHGPFMIECLTGDVIGFILCLDDQTENGLYITGDTVWFKGTEEVSHRFNISTVLAFAGAAKTRGPFHLTMDVNDVLESAKAFPQATIIPVHCEGWAHFSQTADDVIQSFKTLQLEARLQPIQPGETISVTIGK